MGYRIFARLAATAAVSLSMLGACGDDSEPSATTTAIETANPASVFCVEQGGTVDIVDEAGGQVGYCILPDGTRVEEWEYYRSQTARTTDTDAVPVPVTISISGLQGAMGQYLAGVLYSGDVALFLEPISPEEVGGVAATVTSDPFTADLELKIGSDEIPDFREECAAWQTTVPTDCIPFPYLTDEPQLVDPGTYTLLLWLAPTAFVPYSRWVPATPSGPEEPDLSGCLTSFEVGATGGSLTVTGIPNPNTEDWSQPCMVE